MLPLSLLTLLLVYHYSEFFSVALIDISGFLPNFEFPGGWPVQYDSLWHAMHMCRIDFGVLVGPKLMKINGVHKP